MSLAKQDCLLDSGESQRQRERETESGLGRERGQREAEQGDRGVGGGKRERGKTEQEKEIKLEMGQRAVEEKEEGEMRGGERWGAWGSRGELARSSARSIGPEC